MLNMFQAKPYALNTDEGCLLQSMGAQVTIKATSDQTGGVFNLLEITCPAGYSTPLHVHYAEDVAIFVLDGKLTFFWGNEQNEAVAGTYFYQPRGTPHGFRVKRDGPAHILFMSFPAGFDRFVLDPEQPVPDSETELLAARYQIEVIGPLPG